MHYQKPLPAIRICSYSRPAKEASLADRDFMLELLHYVVKKNIQKSRAFKDSDFLMHINETNPLDILIGNTRNGKVAPERSLPFKQRQKKRRKI